MPARTPQVTPAGRAARGVALGAVALLVAFVLGVAVLLAWDTDAGEARRRSQLPAPASRATPTAAPVSTSSAVPAATSSRPAAAAATTPHPALHDRPVEARTPMGSNQLYTLVAPTDGSCGADLLPPPITADPHAGLQAIADCLTATYQAPYRAAMGVSLPPPRVETIDQATETPCGVAIYNGYYCSVNKTIYIRIDALQAGGNMATARIASLFMVAHEFGHHLQHMSGIWEQFSSFYGASSEEAIRQVLRRRLELQADCFAGMAFRTYTDQYGIGPADQAQMAALRAKLADVDHGTAQRQAYWESVGFDFGQYAFCNTWEVPDDLVR